MALHAVQGRGSWSTKINVASLVEKSKLVFTPASTENFIILANMALQDASSTNHAGQDLIVEGTTEGHFQYDAYFGTPGERLPGIWALRRSLASGAARTLRLGWLPISTSYQEELLGGDIIAWSPGDEQYAESETGSTTTSGTYQDKTTLTFTPGSQQDYLIIATAEHGQNNTADSTGCRLEIDGAADVEQVFEPNDSTDFYKCFVAMKRVNLTAASHTIKIQFKSFDGTTVNIRRARIIAIPLGNKTNYYATSENEQTTASGSFVDALTTSPSVNAAKHLVIATCEVSAVVAAEGADLRLTVDSQDFFPNYRMMSRDVTSGEEDYMTFGWFGMLDLAVGNRELSIEWKRNTGSSNVKLRRARIIAIEMPSPDTFWRAFKGGSKASADDAEVDLTAGTIDTAANPATFGNLFSSDRDVPMRFPNVEIENGKEILEAYLDLQMAGGSNNTVRTNIVGFDEDNTAQLSTYANYAGRSITTASVTWDGMALPATDEHFIPPDISSVVQEIIERGGWASGNAMGIVIKNDASDSAARRTTKQYDSDSGLEHNALYIIQDLQSGGSPVVQKTLKYTVKIPASAIQRALRYEIETPVIPHQIDLVQANWSTTSTSFSNIYGYYLHESANFDGSLKAYFQATILTNNASYQASARLYDVTAGAAVPNTQLNTNSTTFTDLQSTTDIADQLIDGHVYIVQIMIANGVATANCMGGRIILRHKTLANPSALTEFQPVGVANSVTGAGSDSYTTPAVIPIVKYEGSQYDGTLNVYFEATLYTSGSTVNDITYARLWDLTANQAVANSEVSIAGNNGNVQRVRSAAISLTNGNEYIVQIKQAVTGDTAYIYSGHLVYKQTGSITKTQLHQSVNGIQGTTASTTFVYFYAGMIFNKAMFANNNLVEAYYEANLHTTNASGIATSNLYDLTNTTTLSGDISTSSTTYVRLRTSSFDILAATSNLDDLKEQLKSNNASYTSYVMASRVIINVQLTGVLVFTIQKSLKYTVITTPAAKTKSLKYTIGITPSAITKSLQYAVVSILPITKSLKYTVIEALSLTKSLKYTILTTPSAITKSLQYTVEKAVAITKSLKYAILTTPSALTKSLAYAVIRGVAITKSLEYAIQTTETFSITKSLKYTVLKALSITKSLQYAILTAPALTKSLKYTIQYTPSAIGKSLKYTVLAAQSITKQLVYAVITTPSALTKSLQYAIAKSTAITKSLQYTVKAAVSLTKQLKYTVISPYAITKSLVYSILTTASIQKSLEYAVVVTTAIQKSLKYTVIGAVSITKSLKYTILTTPSAIQKQLQYAVVPSIAITKSLKYTVISAVSITKGLIYRIAGQGAVLTKSLQYTVVSSFSITKSLVYTVITSPALTKSLSYAVQTAASLTKSLKYTIVRVVSAIQKQLGYAVTSPSSITKSLKYVVTSPVSITKALQYEMDVAQIYLITKSLKYTVKAPVLIERNLTYHIIIDGYVEKYIKQNTGYAEKYNPQGDIYEEKYLEQATAYNDKYASQGTGYNELYVPQGTTYEEKYN